MSVARGSGTKSEPAPRERPILGIWLVAVAEGFSTLAVEVVAIRLATPVVGSSMTLTGVMLGAVLFALSAGYWRGGELSSRWDNRKIRSRVALNLLLAGGMYAALAFPLEAALLEKTLDAGLSLALGIGLTAAVLFVLPVYLASQTVPMLAELTNTEGKAGKASGKVLFFSTLGSVAGGIVTPIFLFPALGVRASTYVICGLLVGASAFLWIGYGRAKAALAPAAILAAVVLSNLLAKRSTDLFAFDSAHQSIRIVEKKNDQGRLERVLYLNGGRASGVFADTGETSFPYVREADRALAVLQSDRVLAIGAAGFTFPRDAAAMPFVQQVDAVDVDPVVYQIAERRFLLQPLPSKIRFFPLSARDAMRQFRKDGKRHGFTLLDAYSGMGVPEELLTIEFFTDVRAISEHAAANFILDREVESAFANNLLATFRRAFGRAWIKDVDPGESLNTNIFVTNWAIPGSEEWTGTGALYTDNRSTADRDRVRMIWQ